MDVNKGNSPTPSTESEGQSPSSSSEEDELQKSQEKLMSGLEMKSTTIHNIPKESSESTEIEIKNIQVSEMCNIEKSNELITNIEKKIVEIENEGNTNLNTDNNKPPTTSPKKYDEYSKNIQYNDDGVAIYTDPKTNYQYQWSTEKNTWTSIDNDKDFNIENPLLLNNPYENEHYRWCSVKNEWIPKVKQIENEEHDNDEKDKSQRNKFENEFYKWNEDEQKWIPKIQTTQSNIVKYDDELGQHTYTDHDNVTFFWDTVKNAWFPKIDDDFMAIYQMNYGFTDASNNATSSSQIVPKKSIENISKLSDMEETSTSIDTKVTSSSALSSATTKRKLLPEPPKWFDLPPEQNTKVYVSNLPLDITDEEFIELMGKCGMIMRDPQTQKNKIKLYTDTNGILKGDGLCDYIKVESVMLALNILDGSDVRGKTIHVQRAKFQMRGEYNPALKPKRKKKDKEKLLKLKEKLFDWRPEKMRGERSKYERVVIIKNLFTPELFDEDAALMLEYQKDLREECTKCGTVRKVLIYDRHQDGVAQISMASPEEADIVVQMMNGRYFGQRKLTAELWDGKTKYKVDETEVEVKNRLSNWDKYLESEEEKKLNEKNTVPSGAVATEVESVSLSEIEPEKMKTQEIVENVENVRTENVLIGEQYKMIDDAITKPEPDDNSEKLENV